MTTPLIEAMARRLTTTLRHHGVELHPEDIAGLAHDALTAITEAGMVIVPREPTEAMKEAGWTAWRDALEDDWRSDAADVYRAMVNATNNGKAE